MPVNGLWIYLHQLGVMAGVYHNSHNPLRVPELSASQKHLVWSQRCWTAENITNITDRTAYAFTGNKSKKTKILCCLHHK